MASIAYYVVMGILILFASFSFFGMTFLFTYAVILPRFKPELAETISGYIVRFAWKRMPGYGLSAHMDASGLHMKPFELRDGMIWINDVPFFSVDEAPVGNALGIPFIATYRNFAGLVNMGLAKVGEEIERVSYDLRKDNPAVTDGGGLTPEVREDALTALDQVAQDLDEDAESLVRSARRFLEQQTKRFEGVDGVPIVIPELGVVDTSKIQYVDTNASVPDKAGRAVKNAVAAERERAGVNPIKFALMILGAVMLGAGAVILTLIMISSLSGSGGGGIMVLAPGVLF